MKTVTFAKLATTALLQAIMISGSGAQTPPTRATPEPPRIVVVGNDYAFVQFPQTIASGKTVFAFRNEGHVRHELSIALLRPGITVQDAMAAIGKGDMGPLLRGDTVVGILIARPGESSGGELLTDLISGRTYVVVCTLKNSPDAEPHTTLGMYTSFEAR